MAKEAVVQYEAATADVYDVLNAVLNAWRPDLLNFEVDAQFVPKGFKVGGRHERATAVLPPERYARWCPDVVVEVAKDAWGVADATLRKALMDHALAHVAVTEGGELVKAVEDAAVFTKLYQRHGAYTEELRRLEGVLQQRVLPGTEGPGVDEVALPARGVEARAAEAGDINAEIAAVRAEVSDDPFDEEGPEEDEVDADEEEPAAPEPEEPVPQVKASGPERCACCGHECGADEVSVHGLGGQVWRYCCVPCLVKDTQRRSHEPGGVLGSAEEGPAPDDEDFVPTPEYQDEVARRLKALGAPQGRRVEPLVQDPEVHIPQQLEYEAPTRPDGTEGATHTFVTGAPTHDQ